MTDPLPDPVRRAPPEGDMWERRAFVEAEDRVFVEQFERELRRRRISELGRRIARLIIASDQAVTDVELCAQLDIARKTFYRHVAVLRWEMGEFFDW